jgi:hypothetical protein
MVYVVTSRAGKPCDKEYLRRNDTCSNIPYDKLNFLELIKVLKYVELKDEYPVYL